MGASSSNFRPSWAKKTYDARLITWGKQLLVTYACTSCVFSISPLTVTAEPTADGGMRNLRVWATGRNTYQHWPWLAGRNQAVFVYAPDGTGFPQNHSSEQGAEIADNVPRAKRALMRRRQVE